MSFDHASLDHAPDLVAPLDHDVLQAPAAPGGRRLRVLDVLMSAAVMAAGLGIAANALVLQGRHPVAPLPAPAVSSDAGSGADKGKTVVRSTSIPLPTANPTHHTTVVPQGGETNGTLGYLASKTSVTGLSTPLKPVSAEEAAAGAIAAPRPVATQRPALAVGSVDAGSAVRPPANIPSSPRVMGVQRALAKLGYGPLKVNGTFGAETRAAIQRFERDRRLPVDGEISDRLVRELGAVSGLAVN